MFTTGTFQFPEQLSLNSNSTIRCCPFQSFPLRSSHDLSAVTMAGKGVCVFCTLLNPQSHGHRMTQVGKELQDHQIKISHHIPSLYLVPQHHIHMSLKHLQPSRSQQLVLNIKLTLLQSMSSDKFRSLNHVCHHKEKELLAEKANKFQTFHNTVITRPLFMVYQCRCITFLHSNSSKN